jgi:N-acetylmuramoyl-L-alanine amidase
MTLPEAPIPDAQALAPDAVTPVWPRVAAFLAFVLLAPLGVFAAMLGVDRAMGAPGFHREYSVRIELPPVGAEVGLPKVDGPLDSSRPLVVIDAGHGGHDPGAAGGDHREKELTLALARALRDQLLAGGGIRVAMTRDDDRYLLLEERSGIARRLKADLFISIHADSADEGSARGATIYTLSTRGSSEEAEKIAAAENRADTVNGVTLAHTSSAVSAILVDLSQRRAAEQSAGFARLILREGEGRIAFRDRPLQSAAFVVLKSPDMPSVLFEAGYISNPDDAARLSSKAGRDALADATAQAIRVYFARQSAPVEAVSPTPALAVPPGAGGV